MDNAKNSDPARIKFDAEVAQLRNEVVQIRELACAAGLYCKSDDTLLLAVLLRRIENRVDAVETEVMQLQSVVARS